MEPIYIGTDVAKKQHFIDGYVYSMINECLLRAEEGEEKVKQLKLFLKTFTHPICPELSEYFLPSINSFPTNFYEENKIEITGLYNCLLIGFELSLLEKKCEELERLPMIIDYVYYLLNEDVFKTEDKKEITSDALLRQVKGHKGSDYIIRSINSFPNNFYEENKKDIDKYYSEHKCGLIKLTKEIEKGEILKEKIERKQREISELEERLFPISETEKIRRLLLEKERKKQLENEVYKTLVDEGHITRSSFDNDDKREPIPQDIMDKVWNRDGGKCVKCGSQENLEFDHIIPHSRGGATSYRNLQILCKKCNIQKTNKIG